MESPGDTLNLLYLSGSLGASPTVSFKSLTTVTTTVVTTITTYIFIPLGRLPRNFGDPNLPLRLLGPDLRGPPHIHMRNLRRVFSFVASLVRTLPGPRGLRDPGTLRPIHLPRDTPVSEYRGSPLLRSVVSGFFYLLESQVSSVSFDVGVFLC